MSTRVDYDVAMEVASHEAIIRQAYRDSAGVWTWSVGLTSATGHRVERYIGKPQPLEHCLSVYVWALRNYADQVEEVFGGYGISKEIFAAALSFHWNTGAIKRASWVPLFKAGKFDEAERAFKSWNKSGGAVVPGLVTRRAKEADLLFRSKWSNDGFMVEYTRLTDRYTPVWSSAKRLDVSEALRAAFVTADTTLPTIDQPPQPDAVPEVPTLSPEDPATGTDTLVKVVAGILAAIGAALAAWFTMGD